MTILEERVEKEMKEAAKARDVIKLSTLRLVRAAVHNRRIDLQKDLEDKDVLQVLSSMAKQRKDSIEQFRRGGRTDLVEREESELAIIKTFLPREMSEQDIRAEVDRVVSELGATGPGDMGAVMKALMPVVAGKADGKVVSDIVKAVLTS